MKIERKGNRFTLDVTLGEAYLLKDAVWYFQDDRKTQGSYGGGSQWDNATDGVVVSTMLRKLESQGL